jgi:hypothetical protein
MEKNPGGGQKVNLLKEELKTWNYSKLESTVILFSDSYDVINLSSKDEIIEKYNKFGTDNILFSAEKTCWPNEDLSIFYPKTNSSYKYLNSGGFIGKAIDIFNMINSFHLNDSSDDQLFYTKLFLSKKYKIVLDIYCVIFQTLNFSLNDVVIDYYEKRIFNKGTNTIPCLIHGNGSKVNKDYVDKVYKILFETQKYIFCYKC